MLNISENSVHKKVDLTRFRSGKYVVDKKYYKQFNQLSLIFLLLLVIVLFLPWTQNVSGNGKVTTLKPGQRPQGIQSAIPGRIEEWFVKEGDLVAKGDTLLRISEVKMDYFDDRLIERTGDQILSKSGSIDAYQSKVLALQSQMQALEDERDLKSKQAINKRKQVLLQLATDSISLQAAYVARDIARTQYERVEALQKDGLKSRKDLEDKGLKLQSSEAKLVAQENKLEESRAKFLTADMELLRLDASYSDKISKVKSDLFSARSASFNAEAELSKMESSLARYSKRNELLYVLATQTGYVNKAIKASVGETFKAGESIVTIMPTDYELAVETFVTPIDLPLIRIGERVRVQFDGWPAIVFSGWESVSYGTYGARVVAVENYIGENGKCRVLLAPDTEDYEWPEGIRVGSGARTIALLSDVPIWYELWRKLNGFPPDFYKQLKDEKSLKTTKDKK